MKKLRKAYPPKTADIKVGLGFCDGEWYMGVQPPIGDGLLRSIGGGALNKWETVEGIPGINGANLLKSTVDLTETEARGAGIGLTLALGAELKDLKVCLLSNVIEMAPNTAPFQNSQLTR